MKKLAVYLMLILSTSMYSQNGNSTERRWLVLVTNESQHHQLLKQLKAIETNAEAAIERKIGVVQLTKNNSIPLFNASKNEAVDKRYQHVFSEETEFEAILIGLDGGIKLRSLETIDVKAIFDLIDSMPMRQKEMRTKKIDE